MMGVVFFKCANDETGGQRIPPEELAEPGEEPTEAPTPEPTEEASGFDTGNRSRE